MCISCSSLQVTTTSLGWFSIGPFNYHPSNSTAPISRCHRFVSFSHSIRFQRRTPLFLGLEARHLSFCSHLGRKTSVDASISTMSLTGLEMSHSPPSLANNDPTVPVLIAHPPPPSFCSSPSFSLPFHFPTPRDHCI